jgi:hypothetical protein
LVYEREVPFELRIQDEDNGNSNSFIILGPQDVGTLEAIHVKILVYVSIMTNILGRKWTSFQH